MTATDVHNALAPQILREIVKATAGGERPAGEMMVILESVCLGVLLYLDTAYGDDPAAMAEALLAGIRQRLADQRGIRTSQPQH